MLSTQVRSNINQGERRYYIKFPAVGDHEGHVLSEVFKKLQTLVSCT